MFSMKSPLLDFALLDLSVEGGGDLGKGLLDSIEQYSDKPAQTASFRPGFKLRCCLR